VWIISHLKEGVTISWEVKISCIDVLGNKFLHKAITIAKSQNSEPHKCCLLTSVLILGGEIPRTSCINEQQWLQINRLLQVRYRAFMTQENLPSHHHAQHKFAPQHPQRLQCPKELQCSVCGFWSACHCNQSDNSVLTSWTFDQLPESWLPITKKKEGGRGNCLTLSS
jgi:hypothetical protein